VGLLGLGCVATFTGALGGGLVGAPLVGGLVDAALGMAVANGGALAEGGALALDASADNRLDRGTGVCAPPILSACCAARALVHAATTATTSALTTPRRVRLDLRRDVEEAKISCHIKIWAKGQRRRRYVR
jgi:hypothetical protein